MVFPSMTPSPALMSMPRPRLFMITLSRSSKPAPVCSLLEIMLSKARPAKPSGQASRTSCAYLKHFSGARSSPPHSLSALSAECMSRLWLPRQGCGFCRIEGLQWCLSTFVAELSQRTLKDPYSSARVAIYF